MNNKNVIVNVRSTAPMKIMESRTEGNDLYLVGEFTTFDIVNRNKRIYKKDNYKEVLAQIADKCASGALMGELGHPDGRSLTDLTQVSHVVTKLEIDDANNCVRGELKLLNTPNGQIARTLVESGVPLFVSSRATGYVSNSGVVTLTNLVTYDLVDEPGFANARLTVRDITESLCSECDELDNVAIFSAEDTGCVPASYGIACDDSKDKDDKYKKVMAAIDSLTANVNKLTSRISSIEKCQTQQASAVDKVESPATIQNIVDSKVSEAIDKIYKKMYDLNERQIKELEQRDSYIDYMSKEINERNGYLDYMSKVIDEIIDNAKKNESSKKLDIIEGYLNEVCSEINKTTEYADYISKEINERDKYLDYMSAEINKSNSNARLDIIEQYLDSVGKEINKITDFTDYIVESVNKNVDDFNLLEGYINEEIVPNFSVYENRVNEFYELNKSADKSLDELETRFNLFNDCVNERLDNIDVINGEGEMSYVKELLEKISDKEDKVNAIHEKIQTSRDNNDILERNEKKLLNIMHPSVKHIWEGFDKNTKLKIINNMSVSECLAAPARSLMLTRLIHTYNNGI